MMKEIFKYLFDWILRHITRQLAISGGLSLRVEWQTSIPPSIEPALELPDVLISAIRKLLRQTGARILVRSGAIRYDRFVFGNLGDMLFKFVHRHANGLWNHHM